MRSGMMLKHLQGKRGLLSKIGKTLWSWTRYQVSDSEKKLPEDLTSSPTLKWREQLQQSRLSKSTKVVQLQPGTRFFTQPMPVSIFKSKFKNWPRRSIIRGWSNKEWMLISGKQSWKSFRHLEVEILWNRLFMPLDLTELPNLPFHKVKYPWLLELLQRPQSLKAQMWDQGPRQPRMRQKVQGVQMLQHQRQPA